MKMLRIKNFLSMACLASMFLVLNGKIQAQDTITFTWKGGTNKSFSIVASENKQFIVYWGDAATTNVVGLVPISLQSINYVYADTNDYTVNIIGNSADCKLTRLDCPYQQVSNLNVCENTILINLNCSHNLLDSLNLNGCIALHFLYCNNNQLSSLNLNGCTALQYLYCQNNQLPLSDLYAASGEISTTNNKRFGPQFLPARQNILGDTIDYSAQAKFNNINTVFKIEKDNIGGTQALINVDYTLNNGVIVFKNAGHYFVSMSNTAIRCDQNYDAIVYAEFTVRDLNTDASLSSLTVSKGKLNPVFHCDTLSYNVDVAYSISDITITAILNDTNATMSGDMGLQQLAVGANIFTITVTAEDKITTRNYTITVNRADTIIDENIIEIANYELRVTSCEIFDILGRSYIPLKGGITPTTTNSPFEGGRGMLEQAIQALPLPTGIYIIKLQTNKGTITKKIIKN